MEYGEYLYKILYPNPSLVASQVTPERFAKHYMFGSIRHFQGKLIFAEIDINYRHPYLKIDTGLKGLVSHDDGRPKATKFISSYRVLEHIDFKAIKNIYLSTPEGHIIKLSEGLYKPAKRKQALKVYAEITPLRMIVLSKHDFVDFGRYITDPQNTKGAPKIFYTQLDIDPNEFLQELNDNPILRSPLPNLVPSKLRDAIHILNARKDKPSKGVLLDCPLDHLSYRLIKLGFMFASQEEMKFFPMPTPEEIKKTNPRFWRSM